MGSDFAGARLEAELGPAQGSWITALTTLRRARPGARHRTARAGREGAVVIRDRQSRRIVREIDCGREPGLPQRVLDMVSVDLRTKTLEEFVDDYGIDPRRLA